jgi:DNA-binding transcriptional LysR family regulator
VTYFHAAITATPGTTLVATVPRRLAEVQVTDSRLRLVEAPEEFDAFPYGMVWHRRLDTDPAHRWLREMIRQAAADMVASRP